MANKRLAILAMIMGIMGVGIGSYSLLTITSQSNESIGVDISRASPALGNDDASITIIEFGDYQCPMCAKWFHNTKPALMDEYIEEGRARLYFIDFPIIGPDSFKAAEASYCALDQGMYWEYHDMLYNNQKEENDGWASKDNLVRFASDLGLDVSKFRECLDSNKYKDRVEYNKSVALQHGLRGTPSFIIINKDEKVTIVGAHPLDRFKEVIDR